MGGGGGNQVEWEEVVLKSEWEDEERKVEWEEDEETIREGRRWRWSGRRRGRQR